MNGIKAVIMAGGKGSRLRPLTCDTPKPMARICGKPVIEYILELLIKNKFNEAYITLGYLPKVITDYFENVEYKDIKGAIESVKNTGYGIATPTLKDMTLDSPEVVKQGSRFGVKLRAIAPSIHMIKVDVESSFEPIIGSEEQSKILLDKIMSDYEKNPAEIWDLEIFGRKLSEVVNDGIKAKLYMLPDEAQYKFRESLEKVVNKGKGGILAFIL